MVRLAAWSCLTLLSLASAAEVCAGEWDGKLDKLDRCLASGEWKTCWKDAEKLREKMVEKAVSDPVPAPLLARTWVAQALAEANLGRDRQAVWHWTAALNFLPGAAQLDLGPYARAAEVLGGISLETSPLGPIPRPPDAEDLKSARVDRSVRATFPKKLIRSGIQGEVLVSVIVDRTGQPLHPVVQEVGILPAAAFPVLDALMDWTFRPAVLRREPFPVTTELRIRYP